MGKVMDEFNTWLYCPVCIGTTKHNIQKIDVEDNEEYIVYYAECDNCNNVLEFSDQDEVLNQDKKERKCRICGCTWFNPCPGGCYWTEKDLCSKCRV